MVFIHPSVRKIEQSERDRKRRDKILSRVSLNAAKVNYEIIQTNGQRVYSPIRIDDIPPPPKGCEVFIGKLPKNVYEDELIPLFEIVGKLYMFRLMLDFSGRNRGFGFATYFTSSEANEAVRKLHNFEIRPKLHIAVHKSVDNRRLFIGNIPTDKSRWEILYNLNTAAAGITEIIMYEDWSNPGMNRGFVFAEFSTHALAALARRQFNPQNLILWNVPLYVDWADPLPDVDPKIMNKVTVLYLKNLPMMYSSEQIHAVVCGIIGNKVKRTHKINHFAFVHFGNRKEAEKGLQKLEGLIIDGQTIEVEWARPRKYSKKNRFLYPPANLCTSVPPSKRKMVRRRLVEVANSSKSIHRSSSTDSTVSTTTDYGAYENEYSYFHGKTIINIEDTAKNFFELV